MTTSICVSAKPSVAWLAVMRVAPRVLACTSRSALVCPGATVTRATAEATEGTLLVMSTTTPWAGAGALRETRSMATTPGLSRSLAGSMDKGV